MSASDRDRADPFLLRARSIGSPFNTPKRRGREGVEKADGDHRSSENMLETERAIRVGRTVADELRRRPIEAGDILVE
jgi:hypothetical protein